MKKNVFKKFVYALGKVVASLAIVVTTLSVNTCCLYIMHQAKLPESAKKLRKF